MRALVAGSFSPSLSPPLCLRFGNGDVLPRGEEERWTTTVKSRKSLPNHWAKFTSSHNHPSSTKRVAIFLDSTVAFLPLPSPHPYHLFKLISCHFCPPPPLPLWWMPWIFLYLQPLGQEEQPRTLEPAGPDLPIQGDSLPVKGLLVSNTPGGKNGAVSESHWKPHSCRQLRRDSPAEAMSEEHPWISVHLSKHRQNDRASHKQTNAEAAGRFLFIFGWQ